MNSATPQTFLGSKSPDELCELVSVMAYDAAYDCWTRNGLEYIVWPEIRARARWIIFGDLDRLHDVNEKLGYEEANRRVRESMQMRKSDFLSAGRWFSGDELVWILCETDDRPPTDPRRAAERLGAAFQRFGLSATFGIARVLSYELAENVAPAARLVQQAKARGQRGSIKQTGSLVWSPFGERS